MAKALETLQGRVSSSEEIHVSGPKDLCKILVIRGKLLTVGADIRFSIVGCLRGWCQVRRISDTMLQVQGDLPGTGTFNYPLSIDETQVALRLDTVSAGEYYSSGASWTSKDAPPVKLGLLSITPESGDLAQRANRALKGFVKDLGLNFKTLKPIPVKG